jgi:ABC-type uncharacterized transport system auxiliary subunit
MRTRLAAALITITMSTFMIGCLGKVKYPTYYTLDLPPAVDPPMQAGVRPSIAVREFRSADYLRQGAIVYRPSPQEVGYYNYQRWAVDPREFVTHAIVDRLRASGKFATVKIYDGRSDVDLILVGRLEKLDEVDYEGGVRVEAALSAQITDLRSGKIVWADEASQNDLVDKRTVPAVVAAMSHAMDGALQKLLASVPASISASPEARQNRP